MYCITCACDPSVHATIYRHLMQAIPDAQGSRRCCAQCRLPVSLEECRAIRQGGPLPNCQQPATGVKICQPTCLCERFLVLYICRNHLSLQLLQSGSLLIRNCTDDQTTPAQRTLNPLSSLLGRAAVSVSTSFARRTMSATNVSMAAVNVSYRFLVHCPSVHTPVFFPSGSLCCLQSGRNGRACLLELRAMGDVLDRSRRDRQQLRNCQQMPCTYCRKADGLSNLSRL